MPSVATTDRPGRDQELLARLAVPLNPTQAPKYLRNDGRLPDGWYWVPAGQARWLFLGRNVHDAAGRLADHLAGGASA